MKTSDGAQTPARLWSMGLALTLVVAACSKDSPGPTGRLDIGVAPLSLEGIVDADYTLTVTNGADGGGEVGLVPLPAPFVPARGDSVARRPRRRPRRAPLRPARYRCANAATFGLTRRSKSS